MRTFGIVVAALTISLGLSARAFAGSPGPADEMKPQFPLTADCYWRESDGLLRSACAESESFPSSMYAVCDWQPLDAARWQARCVQMSSAHGNGRYTCDMEQGGNLAAWRCRAPSGQTWAW